MQNLSMCCICLATDVRLCSIARSLQDMYEKLTELTFKREDGRPMVACYICHARLRNCYQLRVSCLQSGELLTAIMSSGVMKPQDVLSTNSFSVVSAVHISIGQVLQKSTECQVKEEAPEITCDAELDLQYTKDIIKEELCAQTDDNNQCSQLEDPLYIINGKSHDVETDAEYMNLKDETKTIEENRWEPDIASPSLQSEDNICPKVVKVVLERMDLYNTRIGARVPKRPKIAALKDTEDATSNRKKIEVIKNEKTETITIIEPKMNTKVIKVEKPVTTSKILETCDKVDVNVNKCDDNVSTYVVNGVFDEKSTNDTLEQNVSTVSSSQSKPFSCDICMKWFPNKCTFKQHIRTHTGENPYQCNLCKKCFTQKASLHTHTRIHTGEKPYQCNVCKNCFSRKSSLKTHIRIHTGEKPYQCNVCKKCFNKKSDLKTHIRTHTGEKPYQCSVCEKCFIKKYHLQNHIRTHTGEKPYRCNVCKKCFNRKDNLKAHIRTHTGDKP